MQKLILKCHYSLGDIVMLTAAVRDLHESYPGRFATDVRTSCAELWENNPYLTALDEEDPKVRVLKCEYPLINRCNQVPYHCLHGFRKFLNQRLKLDIQPTIFKGDIHISKLEKSWYSQIWELAGQEIPFWIVAAGGKYDVTIKWWSPDRYQQVVDHFRGRIQFVQVGNQGHHHPRLKGVIDLRGKTNVRQLVRLVYHSQGILCGVTGLMHLAAAVEVKRGFLVHRPCVVVAGGRESPHWEAYPFHQFIHTVGALPCCRHGGCWRARTLPLSDGDARDNANHLCVDVQGELPRCMDLISAEEIIRRIELYFNGGAVRYLMPSQTKAAARALAATGANPFDDGPLTIHSVRRASEEFIQTIPPYSAKFHGRGIVICGGGVKYFTNAWVCINMLRRLGCSLPIQLWHLGKEELDGTMRSLVALLGVECVDAAELRKTHPVRRLGGWELKPYAILHCPFREVLSLDADNVPVVNPEFLFDAREFRKTGAIFWPDYCRLKVPRLVWTFCGMPYHNDRPFESGQIVLDKQRCWEPLLLCLWYNEQSDFFYRHIYGDKETFHLAFRKLRRSYAMPGRPIQTITGTMCQHDFSGNRIFQHRNTDKWNLFLRNRVVKGFRYEVECRAYVEQLRRLWDGRIGFCKKKYEWVAKPSRGIRKNGAIGIQACMATCAERDGVRQQTLANLAATDWGRERVIVQMDTGVSPDRMERLTQNAYQALARAAQTDAEYVLYLEDDLRFNHFLRRNLLAWPPLARRELAFASLYNPGIKALACDVRENLSVVDPDSIFGSQAFLMSRSTAKYLVKHWQAVEAPLDLRIARLVARLNRPILYHAPSLVQHVGRRSVWGGRYHRATDFDQCWKAPGS